MRRLLAVTLLLTLVTLLPQRAEANSIWADDCSMNPQDVFDIADQVCVTGDVDYTCPVGPISLPGANIYVVPTGDPPFSGPYIHLETMGGAGGFYSELLWSPPLVPGVYDLILDEGCDGVWDPSEDLRVTAAFEVSGQCECANPPAGYEAMDPRIQSNARCRGACGPDCPSTCTTAAGSPETVCTTQPNGTTHCECVYELTSCGSHNGCRVHDDCYDACAISSTTPNENFWCKRGCDGVCLDIYGLLCNSWRKGNGPYDQWITYAANTSATGPTAGACP